MWIVGTRDSTQALVEPFDPKRGAIAYVSKLYGQSDDEVSPEGPMNAFLGDPPSRLMKARERRLFNRIQQQIARGAASTPLHGGGHSKV